MWSVVERGKRFFLFFPSTSRLVLEPTQPSFTGYGGSFAGVKLSGRVEVSEWEVYLCTSYMTAWRAQ